MSAASRRLFAVDVVVLALAVLGLGHLVVPGRGRETTEAPVVRAAGGAPRPSCFVGSVRLGARAGSIDFRARCRPTAASGDIDVTVARVSLNELRSVPIGSFRRYPLLKTPAGVRRARCVREKRSDGTIICAAKVAATVVLEGRIWVGADNRCAALVNLLSFPSSEPCRGECSSVGAAATRIAGGRPRGC